MVDKNLMDLDFDEMLPPPEFWPEMKMSTKYFLRKTIKRYFLPLIFSFLMFAISILLLLPIYFYPTRLEVIIICFFLCIVFTDVIFGSSIVSFIDILSLDSMHVYNKKELVATKEIYKSYFSVFYRMIINTLRKRNKTARIILYTLLFFICLLLVVVLPSHFSKIAAEPQYLGIFEQFLSAIKLYDGNKALTLFLSLQSFYEIELLSVVSVTAIFFVIFAMYNFYFMLYRFSLFTANQTYKQSRQIYSIAVKENKWAFAAYFFHSFKFYILTFVILYIGLTVGFYFLTYNYILTFVISYICSILGLFIVVPFFIKLMMDINLSFSDIYTDATLKFTIIQKKKLNKNKETKIEEDEKLTSLMKNIKQDRKALYKEIKEMDKKIDDDDITAHTEEGDEFLKNYLKSIGVEAKRFKDKKDD